MFFRPSLIFPTFCCGWMKRKRRKRRIWETKGCGGLSSSSSSLPPSFGSLGDERRGGRGSCDFFFTFQLSGNCCAAEVEKLGPPLLLTYFSFFIPLGPLTNTLLSCSSGEATTGRCCYFTGRKHCWALESPKVFMPSSLFLLKWTGEGASVVSFLRRRSICRKPLYLLCESAPHPPLMVIPTKTFPPFSSSCGWDGYGSVGRSVGRLLAG